ncbi:MAG: alpha-L-fucosidase, partial [Lentisphaerota bacterium]
MRKDISKITWFREAGVGMFIHWGVYSAIGRGEWMMQQEQMPLDEYDQHISEFNAENYNPDEWAQLAKNSGMRYMVLTTKHHDGFCLFDTATTDRNAVKQGPKRDLVKEYVEACRRHGLKVGLYFSLPDWSIQAFNDGPEKAPEAWDAFISLIHEQVRELCTNYG